MERTLVLVKPDAVARGLIGEIIRRFESRTLNLKALKIVLPTRELAARHYAVHKDKPFFEDVVSFMTSGPVVAMVLEGDNAVAIVRNMMGALDPVSAQSGTIRGDFTVSKSRNLVHGSDCLENAQTEIDIWFTTEEILQ